jgi:hypothetical protein
MKTVLSLCDYTGIWGSQYEYPEYEVRYIDLARNQIDVRFWEHVDNVHGVIAQPPCTHFAGSGARWWHEKGEEKLLEGLSVVDACMRIILSSNPQWWVLENPVGRLKDYIGPWAHTYNPCDYGDPYTKRTCLWGEFTMPQRNPVEPVQGSKMHLLPPSENRAMLRSETPLGFAQAFRMANP